MSETTTPAKRPTLNDTAVLKAAALKLAPKVLQWIEQCGEDDTVENVAEMLEPHMRKTDGYEFAKALDGDVFPDAALVEILDDASHVLYSALSAPAVGLKVKDNSAKPWDKHVGLFGTIVSNDEKVGKSTVAFAELNHGVPKNGPGSSVTIGLILNWENLEPAS